MFVLVDDTHLRQISGSEGGDKGSTERGRVRGDPLNGLSSLYVVVPWRGGRGGRGGGGRGGRRERRERRERRGGRGKEGGRREGGGGKVRGLEGVIKNMKGRICG